jgi:hypothetical protein
MSNSPPGQRSKGRYCLASFCKKARHQGYSGERSLVLGPLAWDRARLEAIRQRALLCLAPDALEHE